MCVVESNPGGRAGERAGTAIVGGILAVTAAAFAAPIDPAATRVVSSVMFTTVAVILVLALVVRARIDTGADRLAFSVIAGSTSLALVLSAIDPVDLAGDDRLTLAFRAGPFVTAVQMAAFLVLVRAVIGRIGLLRTLLDGAWVGIAALIGIEHLAPWTNAADRGNDALVTFLLARLEVAALAGIVVVLWFEVGRRDRRTLLHLAAPVLAVAVAQVVFGRAFLAGGVVAGTPDDLVFTTVFAVGALGALRGARWPSPVPRHRGIGAGQNAVTWIPLISWVAVEGPLHLLGRAHAESVVLEVAFVLVGVVRLALLAHENGRLAARIGQWATTDQLTGIPNRQGLDLYLDESSSRVGAMIVVDLDRLETVNDTLGHAVGDEVLRRAAQRMSIVLPDHWLVARLAGDEFAAVADDDDPERVARLAARLIDRLSMPYLVDGREIWVGATGAVACVDAELGPTDLVDVCDLALRGSRERGRVLTADATLRRRAAGRRAMERALRVGLDRGEFFTLYQPKVDLVSGELVGVEALVRWDRPGFGVVSPAEFIPVAEATGLIARIDSWVFADAVATLERWNAVSGRRLRLSTNMSAWQLARLDVAEEVRRVVARHPGVSASQIEVELTETLFVEDAAVVAERLERLRAVGVGISIDDFGSGFTSVAYLREFPVNEVKIDRALTDALDGGSDDPESLAAAVLALARALGLEVVAEGVETVEQARSLRRLGCRTVQGFLFSKPVPAEEIDRLLAVRAPWADLVGAGGAPHASLLLDGFDHVWEQL